MCVTDELGYLHNTITSIIITMSIIIYSYCSVFYIFIGTSKYDSQINILKVCVQIKYRILEGNSKIVQIYSAYSFSAVAFSNLNQGE